jgi:hypothetical protein
MINNRMTHALGALALVTLAACGGGGPAIPDGPDDVPGEVPGGETPSASATLPSPTSDHYPNTLGVGFNDSTEASSVATASASGFGQRTGLLSIVSRDSRDFGYWYSTDTAELAVDAETGRSDRADAYITVPIGEDFVEQGFTVVGEATLGDGRQMLIAEHDISGRRLYIPAEGSPVRVGAISSSFDDDDMVAHGVFGIETRLNEFYVQAGQASYSGLAEASVVGGNRAGNYRGTSQGTVDFETGSFSISADLRSDANNEISVTSSGVMSDEGEMEALMVADGLLTDGGRVDGVFEGEFFGSDAEDIGGTFSGGTGSTNIAGQMLMSR